MLVRQTKMTIPTKHIDFEAMLDAVDRKISLDGQAESHLATCENCGQEFQRVQNLLRAMREDQSHDAPRDVLAYAVNLFSQRRDSHAPSLVQRIVAALTFDSFDRAPAFGVRSGASAARQMLYNAAERDLDIRINPQANDRWAIAGQVLGENCSGGEIILQGAEVNESAPLNEDCEFVLPPVPQGTYHLLLKLGDFEVEVQKLEVGA